MHMPHGAARVHLRCGAGALATFAVIGIAAPARGNADATAYLVNVTVRPGLGFTDADSALRYGEDICNKLDSGRQYAQIVSDVQGDKPGLGDGQAGYLIGQAVNELCPRLIFALRTSASQGS